MNHSHSEADHPRGGAAANLMFPVLVAMYVRLARREEREALAEFGDAYRRYAAATTAFIPRLRRARRPGAAGPAVHAG